MRHKPVLLEETLRCLNLKRGMVVVDGTLGSGGHSLEILKQIGPEGRLIGLDQDPASLERCRDRFKEYEKQVSLHHENFENLGRVLEKLNVSKVDAVILDVGFSSDQLEDADRGFSFERQGPLDMRMNPEYEVCAKDLIGALSEKELANLFFHLGGERASRQYAKAICKSRLIKPIETTQDLVDAIESSFPFKWKKNSGNRGLRSKMHPATRVFQALRIAVNRELEVLTNALPSVWNMLNPKARFAVISFHSLEDRIVKHQFRAWVHAGKGVAVTKKPIIASEAEIQENPRSRSAKLRAVEKKS